MLEGTIYISLELNPECEKKGFRVAVPIAIPTDVLSVIDSPSIDVIRSGDMASQMFCTPPKQIVQTARARREFVEDLLGGIKEGMNEWLDKSDTIMGYPKDES